MSLGTRWARKEQFNWAFDNMGGTPLQACVAGLYSGVTFTVSSNQIVIPEANGGGSVYWVRGVWETDALFPWGGFWAEPETGTDYYAGGSFSNGATDTTVTLGNGLADGTVVQVYYIYSTGLATAKYDALNTTPCIRPAWRSKTDYTYDFAVDRIFDAMAAVYFAYKEQGLDDETILDFLWKAYVDYADSHTGELVFDDFNRSFYDQSSYLLYYNSTYGQTGFDHFGIEVSQGDSGRALRFKPSYFDGNTYSAWFGYGFNWDMTAEYFNTISKVKFKIKGANQSSRIQKSIKTAGTGTSNMVIIDEYNVSSARYYLLTVTLAGVPGVAQVSLQVYDAMLNVETNTTITCPASTSSVDLGHGVKAYWETGVLQVGDVWYLTAGIQEIKPFKLLVGLNDSVPADSDPFGEAHTFLHAIGDYYTDYEEFEIDFSQFWRIGNVIDCRDRRRGYWGSWSNHLVSTGTPYETLYYDVFDPEEINGETFYTKQRFTWNLSSTLIAIGFYVGIPYWEVTSLYATNINFLIKQSCGAPVTIRTKVRDLAGTYFSVDTVVTNDYWTRVTVAIASFGVVVHPLTLVEIGIPGTGSPGGTPYQGQFDVCDLKFNDHITFTGSNNLRIVEFKHQETSLKLGSGPDWYIDDFGFDLSVEDPYPYVPRLAISLNAFGRNSWRGPTLVHYSHPLAPSLVGRSDIVTTELALHADAQAEFTANYGGDPGPVMPVHTRNDIENIALLGTENFNKFCWWEDYPETAHALGQYWGFYRLAEYYFVSGDADAWTLLNNWLDWFDTYVVADGDGWKFPIQFGDSHTGGFDYGDYDPGAAASIVLGCLYIYMRTEDSRAEDLAGKILTDLRENRASGDYGGYLYKSDYHYAWMNALVAHAFGLAVVGRIGSVYDYPFVEDDETHFAAMMANFWTMSGDKKPNLLNADLIPFHNVEDADIWDYAPNYMFMQQMGSMEAVILLLHTAIDWALYNGSWEWFNTLLEFVVQIGLGTLAENQIYKISSSHETTKVATQVAVTYGDFRRTNALYKEAEDAGMVSRLGAIKKMIPMHYGSPVITENEGTAETICNRALEFFAAPKETLQVVADLSATRLELSDVVKVTSGFHGFSNDNFYVTRRIYNSQKLRVTIEIMRIIN